MATRRPASAALDEVLALCPVRMRAVARFSMIGLGISGLGMIGLAITLLPARAQYMALTPPNTAPTPMAAPEASKPAAPMAARPAEHAFNGQLPNQRTGTGRQRVVRDICIGCDR